MAFNFSNLGTALQQLAATPPAATPRPRLFRNAQEAEQAYQTELARNPGMYGTENGWMPITSKGFDGLTSYAGPGVMTEGNSSFGIDPQTGQRVRSFALVGDDQGYGNYLESDLIRKYGSLEAAQKAASAAGIGSFQWSNAKPSSNDPMDIVKSAAPLALGWLGGGLLGGGALGAEAAGGAAGAGATAAEGGAALGSGITATPSTTGVLGTGALGTAGTTAGGIGGEALGTGLAVPGGVGTGAGAGAAGISSTAAPGALGQGFFGAEAATGALGAGSAGIQGGGAPAAGNSGALGSNSASVLPVAGSSLAQLAGAVAPAVLGAYGANQQSNAYSGLANQYMAMGAPYRSRLSDLYNNPDDFLNSPEVLIPIQQGTNILARSLSRNGNPFGSGNALQELQNYASNQLFSRLGQEKDRLAGFGGLSAYNQAAPGAASAGIGAQKGIYDAFGAGLADILNPPRRITLQDLMQGKY